MWLSHLIPRQPCCRGRLALIFSLEVLPVCSSVHFIILSEQPHKFNDWGRDDFPGWLLPRVWCFQLHSWALRDVAVNSPGYGRCVFPKTPTHTIESWGGMPGLFPLLGLLAHTRQLPHSTLDFLGSRFSPHSMKGKWTARTAFGIRYCSAWVVGAKILHQTNLANTKDNLWSVLIILYLFFTVSFTKSKIKSSQSNTISNQSNKLSNKPQKSYFARWFYLALSWLARWDASAAGPPAQCDYLETAHQALDLRMSFFVLLHRLNLPNSESCPIAMGLGFETDFFPL